MGITTDPNSPCLHEVKPDGQNECYLVLSEEERAKGFVRPLRKTYKHIGPKLLNKLRDLTEEEHERYDQFKYVKFEEYSEDKLPVLGKYWTQAELDRLGGCGTTTTMGYDIAATYARDPKFYGATYCCHCLKHFPVSEFIWEDGTVVGS